MRTKPGGGAAPLAAAVLAAAVVAAGLAKAEIGAVGAANDLTTGQPPAQTARQLEIAQPVVQDERIVANDNGLAQIMFLDRTTLTVSPNSEVVLDRYLYDPDAGAGEVALTLARGALRFIGGDITKTRDAEIAAPGASVALRGGLVTVDTDAQRTRVVLWAGEYAKIATDGGVLTLSRPGAVGIVDLGAPDAAPRYDGVIRDAEATALLGAFRSEGDGGMRAGGMSETTANFGASGGASAGPFSTRGALALGAEPAAIPIARAELQLDIQSIGFGDPDRFDIRNMEFVDVGGDGPIRGQLVWRDSSDLDLFLRLPGNFGTVSFFNEQVLFNNGGALAQLDADNLGGVINVGPDQRVENIVVNGQNIPAGRYVFFVNAFGLEVPASAFRLTATGDGGRTVQRLDGVLSRTGENSADLPVDFLKDD
jgi:hypothetical protein